MATMLDRFKYYIGLGVFLVTVVLAWNFYTYFFDTGAPVFTIGGIHDGVTCAGDVTCTITGSDEYRVADLSIFIDGKPVAQKFKVGKKQFEHSFTIPTKSMPNGPHTLKVELTDGSYNKNKAVQELKFIVDNQPLQAAFVKVEDNNQVFQGRTLHLQFQVNKEIAGARVHALSQVYDAFPESPNSSIYECFIPVKCEETPNEYLASVEITDKVGNMLTLETKFQVVAYPFKKQTVTLNEEKIKKEAELGKSNAIFEALLQEAVKNSPKQKLWQGPFYSPIDIKSVSAEFGAQRTTQEKGRYVHQGIDLTNSPKSVVWADQDGIVVVKDRFQESGNTVVIDHGCGVLSLFMHLDSFADIEVGKQIKKGNPIGKLGMTGYANGYHLHWEIRVKNIPVDPMQWVKNNF